LKHQLSEAEARIADLEDDVKRRDQELADAIKRGDEEVLKVQAAEKEKRELQTQLDELQDDFANEKSAKEKLDRAKRELETVSLPPLPHSSGQCLVNSSLMFFVVPLEGSSYVRMNYYPKL